MLEFTVMETTRHASSSRQPFQDADGQGLIVFDPTRLQQAGPGLFDPRTYGGASEPVTDSGRGAAWFVAGPFGAGVLRHYRRGGWMSAISERSYHWRGEARVRSLMEFDLICRLRELSLHVPAAIAAGYWRRGMRYRAAIIVERVHGARSFAELVSKQAGDAPWATVGETIGRSHRAGARHADLNAHNILLDMQEEAWLIDWDKGRLEKQPGPWVQSVLARLERSLRKICVGLSPVELADGMRKLREAHDLGIAA